MVLASPLTEFHERLGARLACANGVPCIQYYGNPTRDYEYLRNSAALLDIRFRSRICVIGNDRKRFLHGQVTNDINKLAPGQGCYAAVTNAKGKMVSDVNIYCTADEYLLDFEPGFTKAVVARLEKYIIADDVQIVDVGQDYALLSVQGPKADAALNAWAPKLELPTQQYSFSQTAEVYVARHDRGVMGFDIFLPQSQLEQTAEDLLKAVCAVGGGPCGWAALETVRIESGLPRFRQDMDETNLAPECGIEDRAISYSKGCYIGQEVIARIRTYGQVAKALRGLRLADDLPGLPDKGTSLFFQDKEVGYITSAVKSPILGANIALGYVRREHNNIGTELVLRMDDRESSARIVELPFVR